MPKVYLGIGSNLGDRLANIHQAIALLSVNAIQVIQTSSIIETAPVGGIEQGDFLNGCIYAETQLSPENLLITLKKIEDTMGRIKTVVNGPRIIDLDILIYDDIKIDTDELTIPHPRMHEREFVLKPLSELNPKLVKQLKDAHL